MGLRAAVFAHLDLDKPDLGVMRLAHFLALAYVMSTVAVAEPWATRMSRILGSRTGKSFQGMGRNSLLFFALGPIASAGGRSLMAAAHFLSAPHLSVHLIGLVYMAAAVIGMFAVVNRIHRTARPRGLSTENRIAPTVPMNSFLQEADEGAAVPEAHASTPARDISPTWFKTTPPQGRASPDAPRERGYRAGPGLDPRLPLASV